PVFTSFPYTTLFRSYFYRFAKDKGRAYGPAPCFSFSLTFLRWIVKRISWFRQKFHGMPKGRRGPASQSRVPSWPVTQPISYQRISLASRCSAKLAPPVV